MNAQQLHKELCEQMCDDTAYAQTQRPADLTPMQVVRIFERLWAPIQRNLDEGQEADAGFDAGEFSGSFHHEYMVEEHNACVERLAEKIHWTPASIHHALQVADERQWAEEQKAIARLIDNGCIEAYYGF